MNSVKTLLVAAALTAASLSALAQTAVKEPWVRATVTGQKATGMFALITSKSGGKLVSASSPVANVVEVHEMAMEGSMMKMRHVPALDLPAGQEVALKPGSYHVMLMDLKQPIKAGDTVPVTLVVEDKAGVKETIEVKAPAKGIMGIGQHDHH